MHKFMGCDSFIATYINGDYPNLKYTPGLRIEEVPRVTEDWLKDSCMWLKNNAHRIDILNIYHLTDRSWRHALAYKMNNRKGKIYLKLDGVPRLARTLIWRNIKPYLLMSMSEFVSTEFSDNAEILSRKWHHRIGTVPNPINPSEIYDFRPFSGRSNTILTVGRLGTKQKATEILLEAFARISSQIPDWKLKLAGCIEENMTIADDFYNANPELRERVIFTGQIIDRKKITELYRDAKIFAFPSRWESFGIALNEAMVNGCFAVTTNIQSSTSLTENFRYALGSNVDDIDGLAQNLLYACTHEQEIESLACEGRDAALSRCDLKRCCDVIAQELHI